MSNALSIGINRFLFFLAHRMEEEQAGAAHAVSTMGVG